ncbi:MAG: M28 family peptidase [Flavobacteriales bacterium]|nr:M28 family peptidase [Flavobacteriales bacterium]
MRTSAFIVAALLCGSASAQSEVLSLGRAYVDTLASPHFDGRGYVNEGCRRAGDYLLAEFQRIGLKPPPKGYAEPFRFDVNTFPDSATVRIDGRALRPGVDFLLDPASGSANGTFTAARITPADLSTPQRKAMTMGVVNGLAVLLEFPPTTNKDSLAMYAAWEKELLYQAPVLKRAAGKLTWGVAQEARRFPLIEVVPEAWPDSARTVVLRVNNQLLRKQEQRNILGVAPAKKKTKEWIVVTAHYDHLGRMGPALFPGANDNASGTAMLLCLARHYVKNPGKRNILFIAFAGEEAGLEGSSWCVVNRAIDWAGVKLLINLDIFGTGDEGITVVNATAQQKAFDQLVAINARTPRLATVKSRGPACNSDHCPFAQRGVPALFLYTMGGIKAYHDVDDRRETLPLTAFPALHATLVEFITTLK